MRPAVVVRPGLVVRPAREQDLDAAGVVARAAYEAEHLVGEHYLATIGDARARAREAVVAVAVDPARPVPNGASGVLGPVVGSVTFVLPGSRWAELAGEGQAEFRMLGVHPRAQGRGVGRALVRGCLDAARAAGARELLMSSASSMSAAHRLYAALGFTRRPHLDWSPEPGVDLLGFGLVLHPGT